MDAAAGDLDEEHNIQPLEPDVSTVKKSTDMMLGACARRNSRHDRPLRLPAGPSCSSRRIYAIGCAHSNLRSTMYGADDGAQLMQISLLNRVYLDLRHTGANRSDAAEQIDGLPALLHDHSASDWSERGRVLVVLPDDEPAQRIH